MHDPIKVRSVTRSKYMPLSFMNNSSDSIKPEFLDLYLSMLRNQVTIELRISFDRNTGEQTAKKIKEFGENLQEYLDKNCKGFWSENDDNPVEVSSESENLSRLSVFDIKVRRLFEYEEDADQFVKNYALIQKLTLG